MQKYLTALDSYFYEKLDGEVAIRFERAIRTKGSRDHMQIQIIPVPQKMLKQIMPIFLQKLDTTGLRFHEIQVLLVSVVGESA